MTPETQGSVLVDVVVLLGAGVIGATVFKRLGLGAVLGYFAGGLAIGPFGLGWFTDPQAILHVAELGVVMFLFLIGLEMKPSRLWNLRRQIFGLGVAQVAVCAALLTGVGALAGLPPLVAFLAAAGFVLSSTAAVMQVVEERGEASAPGGQQIMAILLLEDLAIVPLLALVAFLAPGGGHGAGWQAIVLPVAAVAALVAAGVWLLNPLFRVLAALRAREVMTAAALLLVLGTALLMQASGLSMAMGAFLAGVLLAESTFRHQLEADIEPFRSILLGLFFLSVGMSLDASLLASQWGAVLATVATYMAVQGLGVYGVARAFGSRHAEALSRAALMAQGGEFAFVLYGAAAAVGLLAASQNAFFSAVVILSMALTPLLLLVVDRLIPEEAASMDGVEAADGLRGTVLIIGFGRFGQVMSQALLARGVDVTIIDRDVEMIRSAAGFGFKVYYGDGCRLDVLRAAGAFRARAIAVCVDDRKAANRAVELLKVECPLVRVLVRAYDREHALQLIHKGVDLQIRETFESALAFGEMTLRELGLSAQAAAEVTAEVRRRDAERVALEVAGGLRAGLDLLIGNAPKPTPFTPPRRAARALNEETAAVTGVDPA